MHYIFELPAQNRTKKQLVLFCKDRQDFNFNLLQKTSYRYIQHWHSSKRGYRPSKAGVAVLVLEMALTWTLYSLEKWEQHHLRKEKKANNNQHYRLYTKLYAKLFLSTTSESSGKVTNVPKSCNSLGLDAELPIRTPKSMIFLLYHTTPGNIYSGLQYKLMWKTVCFIDYFATL